MYLHVPTDAQKMIPCNNNTYQLQFFNPLKKLFGPAIKI